jgi:predicted permease
MILGLAIGASTAAFMAANSILLRPLPFSSGDRLVELSQQQSAAAVVAPEFSVKEIQDLREQGTTWDSVFEYHEMTFTLLGGREPLRVDTGVVSANFFRSLGVTPLYGRDFLDEDEKSSASPVLIVSYQFWDRAFHRDPDIVGRKFSMNDKEHIVVGVLPPLPQFPEVVDVYMPTSACPTRSSHDVVHGRTHRMSRVFATLKPAVTLEQARADLLSIAARERQAFPETYQSDRQVGLSPEAEDLRRDIRPVLIALAAAAALLLLLACFNTAGLMLSRMLARTRDLGIRSALGASTARLVRSYITEGMVLAFMGGAVGLALTSWSMGLLVSMTSKFTTLSTQLHLGAEVFGFWLVLTIAIGLFLGITPAIGIKTSSLWGIPLAKPANMRRGNMTHRAVLVGAQLALSVVLLVASGLTLRTVVHLQHLDGGFQAQGALTARFYLLKPHSDVFFNALLERTRALPGVQSVGLASAIPLSSRGISAAPNTLQVEEEPGQPRSGHVRIVSRDYFHTIGVRVVEGREFSPDDSAESPPVLVVNQHLARHYWGDQSPVGKHVKIWKDRSAQIVGVVSDMRQAGLDKEPLDEIFGSWEQTHSSPMTMVVRATGSLEGLSREIAWVAHDIDKDVAITDVQPLTQVRAASLASPRITATFLTIFAVIALAITASGISGMMALMVNDRRQEIGIRLALGATPGAVMRAMFAKVAPAMFAGVGIGLAAAWWLSQSMDTIVVGVPVRDSLTFATSSVVLAATAVLFAVAPLTNISRLDPSTPLRAE